MAATGASTWPALPLASTGETRRRLLKALLLAPVAALAPAPAGARAYATAVGVLDAIEGLEAEVSARLHAFLAPRPDAASLVASLLADHARLRFERARLRRRLRLAPAGAPPAPAAAPRSRSDREQRGTPEFISG